MTTTIQNLLQHQYIPITDTSIYASPADTKTVIDAFSVTNTTAADAFFSVNIVPSGDTITDETLSISDKVILPHETYLCPEIIGQVLEGEDFVSAISDTASALTVRVSGRVISE